MYQYIKDLPDKQRQDWIWDKIIYANPIKANETLQDLNQYKPLVTYDNYEEIKEAKEYAPSAGLALRIKVPNTGAMPGSTTTQGVKSSVAKGGQYICRLTNPMAEKGLGRPLETAGATTRPRALRGAEAPCFSESNGKSRRRSSETWGDRCQPMGLPNVDKIVDKRLRRSAARAFTNSRGPRSQPLGAPTAYAAMPRTSAPSARRQLAAPKKLP